MVNKNANIIIGIIIVAIAIYFIGPQIGLFATIPYTSQCGLPACPEGYTDIGATCNDATFVCTRNCQKIVPESCGSYSSESEKQLSVDMPNFNSWYHTPFVDTRDNYCYKYKTYTSLSVTGANTDSKTFIVYTKDGSTYDNSKTTTSSTASVSVTSPYKVQIGGSDIEAYGKFTESELWSFDTMTLLVKLYYSIADYTPAATYNSQTTCTYQTCSEGQIVIVSNQYQICHNRKFENITDIIILTPAEQAEVAKMINDLNATIQEKYQIIKDLNLQLDGQIIMINSLNATLQEKIALVQQLQTTITGQDEIIRQMQLNISDQAIAIQLLSQNIEEQAQRINELNDNLAAKIALVDLLTANNQRQADLIIAMRLEFSEQIEIVNSLNLTIAQDADIIRRLNLDLQSSADFINRLQLDNNNLANLVDELTTNLEEEANLITALNLRIEDQLAVIHNLNLSLAEEQQLVTHLRSTIEEQQILIEQLKNYKPSGQESILNVWENYKVPIIIILAVIFAALLIGGKKR